MQTSVHKKSNIQNAHKCDGVHRFSIVHIHMQHDSHHAVDNNTKQWHVHLDKSLKQGNGMNCSNIGDKMSKKI